jgi:molybdopterin molybdotransferase
MISVSEALDAVTGLFSPLETELVPLRLAAGRILAEDVKAQLSQPPFASSAMDGYALLATDVSKGAQLTLIGESAAGSGFEGRVKAGQTVRIFTGAPVPAGADLVLMQENTRVDGNVITITEVSESRFIRKAGNDFSQGDIITAPRRLTPADIALMAAMNLPELPCVRRPVVALIATGDELVMPGEVPGPDQIIASNNFGLAALLEAEGAEVRLLPIARDTPQSLRLVFELCEGADLIVTIGGASVGDHDIVHQVASDLGLKTEFYKVRMRPGKPLMAGRLGRIPMIGLPGNPVSAMVCGHIFLRPAIGKMTGLGGSALPRELARLGADIGKNGGREHYLRAALTVEGSQMTVRAFERQDSALLSVLSQANALLVRAPDDPPRKAGDMVDVIRLTTSC